MKTIYARIAVSFILAVFADIWARKMSPWVAKWNVPRSQFVLLILAVFPPILEWDKCLIEWPSETPPEATCLVLSGCVFADSWARQMSHLHITAIQNWCLLLSRPKHAKELGLWPETGQFLPLSGCQFSYGCVPELYGQRELLFGHNSARHTTTNSYSKSVASLA